MNKPTLHWKGHLGRAVLMFAVLALGAAVLAFAQSGDGLKKVNDPANGRGVMVAGELWDSFMPMNKGPYHGESSRDYITTLVRMGNFDRLWTTPTHLWPGGWNFGNWWNKGMEMVEWNPSPTFNPQTINGKTNPLYHAGSGPNYCVAAYGNTLTAGGLRVPGQGVAARDYSKETKFVNANRHHAMYEAAWPTNLGVDVKLKAHQWTLNWNNFNDFIILEYTLTNTGKKDINLDNIPEDTANVIHALTLLIHGEYMSSMEISRAGTRLTNRFGAQRAIGYIGDNDPTGIPWDIAMQFPGESANNTKDMGLNSFPFRFYSDVWCGWSWLGAKKPDGSDKTTMFGTHPIGTGTERGWYTTSGQAKGLPVGDGSTGTPDHKGFHTASMGVWYKDGGKSRDATKFDLSPDPNFFESGTAGNPETFVPKAAPERPRGDRKLFSMEASGSFEVNPYEPGWTKGFTGQTNFDGDPFSSVGPFRLEVGESITITLVEVAGYRMEGVQNAVAAARLAYEMRANDYADFDAWLAYPRVPEMRMDNTLTKSIKVRWDNLAETETNTSGSKATNFAGYKIYKAGLAKQVDYLATGMRGLDNYWQNMTPGATPANLLKPINPSFSAQAFVAGRFGVPDVWGPYELVAVIPKAQIGQYADNSVAGYSYAWEDKTVDLGFKYWYYVSAYTAETTPVDLGPTYSGTNPKTTSMLETSNMNKNGATGLWVDTYPLSDQSTFYPKTGAKQKEMGTGFIVKSALANPSALASGQAKISVKPNPYKKKALFDNATDAYDHKVTFYNLPPNAKITIIDVSGQLIKELYFQSNDPNNGSMFWDMFSKDGVEVASGLYIYVVEYDGGKHVGYLSILR